MKKTILLMCLFVIAIAGNALAQEHPEHPEHPKKQAAAAEVIDVTLEGENFCVGCSLKKEKGASANCSKYGHRHALKVTSAKSDGKDHPEMIGWVLHYLDTESAQAVIKEHHGETVTMTGKIYADERVFEVGELADAAEDKKSEKPEHPEHPK